jgi:hypothetical protein
MASPEGSFERYLERAVQLELGAAGLLDPASDQTLGAMLLRNDVSAGTGSRGRADLEALFVLRRAGVVLYQQPKSAHHEWWAPVDGGIAITAAVENYPVAVGKLIRALLRDPEFRKALGR